MAVSALLAVMVSPLMVSVSPLFIAFKVRVEVDLVPPAPLTSAAPKLNTFVGVGSMPFLSTKQKEEEVAARTARLEQVKSVLESMWNGVTTCLGVAVSPDLVCELLKRVWREGRRTQW